MHGFISTMAKHFDSYSGPWWLTICYPCALGDSIHFNLDNVAAQIDIGTYVAFRLTIYINAHASLQVLVDCTPEVLF